MTFLKKKGEKLVQASDPSDNRQHISATQKAQIPAMQQWQDLIYSFQSLLTVPYTVVAMEAVEIF